MATVFVGPRSGIQNFQLLDAPHSAHDSGPMTIPDDRDSLNARDFHTNCIPRGLGFDARFP